MLNSIIIGSTCVVHQYEQLINENSAGNTKPDKRQIGW